MLVSRAAMRATASSLFVGCRAVCSGALPGFHDARKTVACGALPRFVSSAPLARLLTSAKPLNGPNRSRAASVQPAAAYSYDAALAEATPPSEIAEVDFDPALANSVRLIGIVGGKREMRVFERSKLLPFAIGIKTDRRKPDEIEWLNVEVWGPLAERADQQLQKGDQVALQGRIKVDRWEDKNTGQKRSAMKIVAASISRVRSMLPPRDASTAFEGTNAPVEQAPWDPLPPAPAPTMSRDPAAASQQQQMTTEDKWMDFFMNPDMWHDNRLTKTKSTQPDFRKKERGMNAPALWIESRDTPKWVENELQRLDAKRQ